MLCSNWRFEPCKVGLAPCWAGQYRQTPTLPVRAGDAIPVSHAFQFPEWLREGVLFSIVLGRGRRMGSGLEPTASELCQAGVHSRHARVRSRQDWAGREEQAEADMQH